MLSLEEKKVKPIIKEIVASRRRMLLVQAVSQYRQKRPAETVVSLQNLLSCSRALPEKDAIQWSESCLFYKSPRPRDYGEPSMPSSALTKKTTHTLHTTM